MEQGSPEYHAAVRRWSELYLLKRTQKLTFEQAIELEALERRLSAAELRALLEWEEAADAAQTVSHAPFSVLADDYDFAVGQAGNLGGGELI